MQNRSCRTVASKWEFPKLGVPYLAVLLIRTLVFKVLYQGPPFPEAPKSLLWYDCVNSGSTPAVWILSLGVWDFGFRRCEL